MVLKEVIGKDDKASFAELVRKVEPEDLIRFGLIPEFIGRMPVIATLEELTVEALVRILKEPNNALIKQYQALFDMEDVDIDFKDDALLAIAEKAVKRQAGARGLRSIIENILLDTMFDLPELKNIDKVVINSDVVNGKCPPILMYLAEDQQAS